MNNNNPNNNNFYNINYSNNSNNNANNNNSLNNNSNNNLNNNLNNNIKNNNSLNNNLTNKSKSNLDKIYFQVEYIKSNKAKIDLVEIFMCFKKDNGQEAKIRWHWGSEKKFRYYLDVLIQTLLPSENLKSFKEKNEVKRTIDCLNKLWEIILKDNTEIFSQSDFYLLVLKTKFDYLKKSLEIPNNFNKNININENNFNENINNENTFKNYIILLSKLIKNIDLKKLEEIDKLEKLFYKNKLNQQISSLKQNLSVNFEENNLHINVEENNLHVNVEENNLYGGYKNEYFTNEDFTNEEENEVENNNEQNQQKFIFEILLNLQLCLYFLRNPFRKSDLILAFVLNAYKIKLINPFKFRMFVIDELDFFTKKNKLFEFLVEKQKNNNNKNIYNFKNKNERFENFNLTKKFNSTNLNNNIRTKKNKKYYQKYNKILSNLNKIFILFNISKIYDYVLNLQVNSNKNLLNLPKYKNINELKKTILESIEKVENINETKREKLKNIFNQINNKNQLIQYLPSNSLSKLRLLILNSFS